MERVVEDVEDDGETEGSPANCQGDEDSFGGEVVRISRGVNYSDRSGH